jgi:hypothetical protein
MEIQENNEESSGLHLIEIHAPTLGWGITALVVMITLIGLGVYLFLKCRSYMRRPTTGFNMASINNRGLQGETAPGDQQHGRDNDNDNF